MLPFLMACLAGCSGATAPVRAPHQPAAVLEPAPVVLFRILIIRDWDSLGYIIAVEDHDWTLQEAIAFGLPAELWIKCAMENPRDFRQEVFWVRPLRC